MIDNKKNIELKDDDNKINIANNIINNLFNFKNKKLEDILILYNNNNDNVISVEDIYYYIYHLKQNKGAKRKYTKKFKNLKNGIKYVYLKIYSEKNAKNII